jgi:hypothetical protein
MPSKYVFKMWPATALSSVAAVNEFMNSSQCTCLNVMVIPVLTVLIKRVWNSFS